MYNVQASKLLAFVDTETLPSDRRVTLGIAGLTIERYGSTNHANPTSHRQALALGEETYSHRSMGHRLSWYVLAVAIGQVLNGWAMNLMTTWHNRMRAIIKSMRKRNRTKNGKEERKRKKKQAQPSSFQTERGNPGEGMIRGMGTKKDAVTGLSSLWSSSISPYILCMLTYDVHPHNIAHFIFPPRGRSLLGRSR